LASSNSLREGMYLKKIAEIVRSFSVPAFGAACGIASSWVFWRSSDHFIHHHTLGKVLARLFGVDFASWILFISAANNTIAFSIFATMQAEPEFVRLFSAPMSRRRRIAMIGTICLLTVLQALPDPVCALGIRARHRTVILAAIGSIPTAFYAATNIINSELTRLGRALQRALLLISRYSIERVHLIDVWQKQRTCFELHHLLVDHCRLAQMQMRHNKQTLAMRHLQTDTAKTKELLNNLPYREYPPHRLASFAKRLVQLAALVGVTGVLSSVNFRNIMQSLMADVSDNLFVQSLGASFLGMSMYYVLFQLGPVVAGSFFEILYSYFFNRPINDFSLTAFPRTVVATFIFDLIISVLSFPFNLMLLTNNYDGPALHELDIDVAAATVIVNVASMMLCLDEILQQWVIARGSDAEKDLHEEYVLLKRLESQSPAQAVAMLSEFDDITLFKAVGQRGQQLLHTISGGSEHPIGPSLNG